MRLSGPINEVDVDPTMDPEIEGANSLPLRPEFRQFLEWVFGPNGVPTVQFIAYGDFSYGGRRGRRGGRNLILRRGSDGTAAIQVRLSLESLWDDVPHQYRNLLEACPLEPLLRGGIS